MQIKLAMENPAEYTRLVTGLASVLGDVQLANGDTIKRETAHDDDRSMPSKLLQPAFMEYANGGDSYDDTKGDMGESHHDGFLPWDNDDYSGLTGDHVDRLMDGINGESLAQETGNDDDVIDRIRETTDNGIAVPVDLNWGGRDENGNTHGGHKVLVTKLEGDRVYYNNPWGQQESMDLAEFQGRLKNSHFGDFAGLA